MLEMRQNQELSKSITFKDVSSDSWNKQSTYLS